MTIFRKAIMATACASLLLGTAGCVTDPVTGQQSMTRGGKGAVAGAALRLREPDRLRFLYCWERQGLCPLVPKAE